MGSSHLYNTTSTHSREEGRSNTPTYECMSTAKPLFKCTFQKKIHTCKNETDNLPHFRPSRQVSPNTHNAKTEGGGG